MKDDTEDPRPPCMACGAPMEYTGEQITTSVGVPILKCIACGTRGWLQFSIDVLGQSKNTERNRHYYEKKNA